MKSAVPMIETWLAPSILSPFSGAHPENAESNKRTHPIAYIRFTRILLYPRSTLPVAPSFFISIAHNFYFLPNRLPSLRVEVMGQAEPAPLLQPLRGRQCALNQLSYKCQPSPYSHSLSHREGVMGETSPVSLGGYGGVQRGPKGGIAKVPWPHSAKKKKIENIPSSFLIYESLAHLFCLANSPS